MKRLFYISLALVLISTTGCKRNRAERQYERYLSDSNRVEFVTPATDTVVVEEEVEEDDPAASETDGIFAIPDTPGLCLVLTWKKKPLPKTRRKPNRLLSAYSR